MTDQELSDGVVAYLQKGSASSPRADEEAARAVATGSSPEELVERVKAVVAESLAVTVDWNSLSLGDAGRAAAAETAGRHPGLDETAREALAWNFSFAWR
ncbi:hypothetical protein BH10ACT10_BH10ACT10_28820 [soil metagenome]